MAIASCLAAAALLGAVLYLPFRSDIRPNLERDGH